MQIRLFGTLEVFHAGQNPQRPPTQKALSLLGYLIMHRDTPQGRDKLVDMLWPETLPRQGRRMLSDTLWRARRLLTPPAADDTSLLIVSGDTVTFRLDDETSLDVAQFEQLAGRVPTKDVREQSDKEAQFAFDQIRAAIDLYRGDFLEDCYDDWALYERERLRERYLGLVQHLLTSFQTLGRFEEALDLALRLVHSDPLREDGHRALIQLYYLLGRETEALGAYEACRAKLMEELGVEPDPATSALYEEIVALRSARVRDSTADDALNGGDTASPLAMVSATAVQFVGRRNERAALLGAVEAAVGGKGGLVLLAGAAGLGKSQLLREVAVGADWRGAQVSMGRGREDAEAVPLGPLRDALAAALTPLRARQVAAHLGSDNLRELAALLPQLLPELVPSEDERRKTKDEGSESRASSSFVLHSTERPAERVYAAIARTLLALAQSAPQVLLLEDIHWFDRATLTALDHLLPHLRTARVLLIITGRDDELSQRSEVWAALLRMDHSGLLQRIDLTGLSEDECAELVRRALGMAHIAPNFSARLHTVTGGNPFFILETLRSLQEQGLLTRDENGLWHTAWDAPGSDYHDLPLPAGLRQAIDERLRTLAPQDREALAAAAVLGQSFAPSVWAQMTEGGRPETGDRRPEIEDNEPEGRRQEAEGSGQETQNSKLKTQNSSSFDSELLRRQFLREDHDGYRFGHDTLREVVYTELRFDERQRLHMRAAEALEREHYTRVEALAQHFYMAGAWQKALPYLLQAGDRAREVCAYREALERYNQAVECADQPANALDSTARWEVENKRGELYTLLGDYDSAIEAFEQVLDQTERDATTPDARARLHSRRSTQIQALSGLCYVYGQMNDYVSARDASERALTLARESPRLADQAAAYYQAGFISYRTDNYEQAEAYLQRALELYEALDSQEGQARCISKLVDCWRWREGITDRVLQALQRAIAIYHTLSDQYGEYDALLSLANAYLMRGSYEQVLRCCADVLPFFRASDGRDDISRSQYLRGVALTRMGRFEEALEALDEALTICKEMGRPAAIQFAQINLSHALQGLGRYDEAQQALNEAYSSNNRLIKLRALNGLAELSLEKGDIRRAFRYIADALLLSHNVDAPAIFARALRVLGQVRAADTRGILPAPSVDAPDSEACFRESASLLTSGHNDADLGMTYAAYGSWLLEHGRIVEAKTVLGRAEALLQQCGMQPALEAVQKAFQQIRLVATPIPGHERVRLARLGVPRGRPLRADEFVEVLWTLEADEDAQLLQREGKVAQRQARIRRLCAEANAQGAEPTVEDLADALRVAARTVNRDLAAMRAEGERLVTRGGS